MFEFSFNVNSCQAKNLAARAVFIRQFRAQREADSNRANHPSIIVASIANVHRQASRVDLATARCRQTALALLDQQSRSEVYDRSGPVLCASLLRRSFSKHDQAPPGSR